MSKPRIVAYVRVSTAEEDVRNQKVAIVEFLKRRGWVRDENDVIWFEDVEESRLKPLKERLKGRQLLDFIRSNKVDYLVVYALDRLGAGIPDIFEVLKELKRHGVKVISVREDWLEKLSEAPINIYDLILAILSWVSQVEIELRKARVEAAKKAGKCIGRPDLIRFYAATIYRKLPKDITPAEYEEAKKRLKRLIRKLLQSGVKKTYLPVAAMSIDKTIAEMYRRFPNAPRDYRAYLRVIKEEEKR